MYIMRWVRMLTANGDSWFRLNCISCLDAATCKKWNKFEKVRSLVSSSDWATNMNTLPPNHIFGKVLWWFKVCKFWCLHKCSLSKLLIIIRGFMLYNLFCHETNKPKSNHFILELNITSKDINRIFNTIKMIN